MSKICQNCQKTFEDDTKFCDSCGAELTAAEADISSLETDVINVTGRLTATEASIGTLNATTANIKGDLTAVEADINSLESKMITTTNLKSNIANIEGLTVLGLGVTGGLSCTTGIFDNLYVDRLYINGKQVQL